MTCKNCKASIPNDSMFCPSCGQKVEAEPVAAPAPTFSSAFRRAGSLDGSDFGMGAPVEERKSAMPDGNSGLRFSSGFKHTESATLSSEKTTETDDMQILERPERAPSASAWFLAAGGLDEPTKSDSGKKVLEVREKASGEEIKQLDFSAEERNCSKDNPEVKRNPIIWNKGETAGTAKTGDDKRRCFTSIALASFFRKHKKVLSLAVAICCVFLIIVFCGVKKARTSEKLIKEDVKTYYSDFLVHNNMDVVSIKIIDQKTDSKNNTDEVYAEVVFGNTTCMVTRNLIMWYYKYNDGWRLEEVQSNGQSVEILNTEITDADAQMALLESNNHYCLSYGDISFAGRDTQLENGTDVFYYTITVPARYCTENYTASVSYVFEGYSWVFDSSQVTQEDFDWDILGSWHYNAGDANIWLNILSQEGNNFELEFSIQYNYSGWYNSGQRIRTSNGIDEVYGYEDTDPYGNTHLQLELKGYNADGEYVDAGWIEVYPDYGLSWDDIGATGGPFDLEFGEGINNTTQTKFKLSDLFALDMNYLDYMNEAVTDQNGITYDGYFDFESFVGMYRFDSEIIYDLNDEYTNFSGTYFCDPQNNDGDTIRVEIYCDDMLVYTTGELDPSSPVSNFSLDVTDVEELKIRAISDSYEDLWDDNYHRPSVFLVDAYVEK